MDIIAETYEKQVDDLSKIIRFAPMVMMAGVGFIACQYHASYILASLVIIYWGVASSRVNAYICVLTYSVFSTWVVVPAIVDYMGWHPAKAFAFWLIALLMSTVPWLVLYRNNTRYLEIRLALLLLVTWAPPIGFVQFASPFVGSSMLLAGAGWLSITAGLVITGIFIRAIHKGYYRSVSIAITVTFAVALFGKAETIDGWVDVNTSVKVGGIAHTIEGSMDALSAARRVAFTEKPLVAVLGESTGGYSPEAGKSILRNTTINTIVLAGGRVDEKQAVFMWDKDSAVRIYDQRVRPILLEHMDGALDGNKTALVNGLSIAPMICYEGSVPYPLASAMFEKPQAIVSLANFHWSRNDVYFERVLRAHISAWGRIFGIPTIVAVNRRGNGNV